MNKVKSYVPVLIVVAVILLPLLYGQFTLSKKLDKVLARPAFVVTTPEPTASPSATPTVELKPTAALKTGGLKVVPTVKTGGVK